MALKPLELTTCVIKSAASLCNMMQLYLRDRTLHNLSFFGISLAVVQFDFRKYPRLQHVTSNGNEKTTTAVLHSMWFVEWCTMK